MSLAIAKDYVPYRGTDKVYEFDHTYESSGVRVPNTVNVQTRALVIQERMKEQQLVKYTRTTASNILCKASGFFGLMRTNTPEVYRYCRLYGKGNLVDGYDIWEAKFNKLKELTNTSWNRDTCPYSIMIKMKGK